MLSVPDLSPLDIPGRLLRLRAALDEAGVDGLVVTNLTNVRYLTGFTGSAGVLAITEASAVLTTDGRYRTQASEQLEASGASALVDIQTWRTKSSLGLTKVCWAWGSQ